MPFKLGSGKPKTTPTAKLTVASVSQSNGLDYEKLWYAVAMHESSAGKGKPCSTAWHKAANNCVSILHKRKLVNYASVAENKAAFKSLWKRVYGGKLPTLALAKLYSGNDKAQAWLNNVLYYYNKP